MDRITQEAYYRQRVMKYAEKHGVTKAGGAVRNEPQDGPQVEAAV